MTHHEKRATSRLTIRDDVKLVVLGVTDGERCVLENISMGGVQFFSSRKLAVGNRVELRIPAPEEEPEIVLQVKILRLGNGDHNRIFGYALHDRECREFLIQADGQR